MKKIVSTVLVFALMLSAAACSKETSKETSKKSKSDSTTTTKESVVEDTLLTEESETEATQVTSEPNQTLPSDVNISETSETTEQPQPGKYTYTVYEGTEYEETFTLDVNIDEYFYVAEGNGERYFDLPRLCKELGFTIYDRFNKPIPDGDNSGEYISFTKDDLNVRVDLNRMSADMNPDYFSDIQVRFFASSSDDSYYDYESVKGEYEYYDSNIHFCQQKDRYAYIDGVNDYLYGLSYDGIVVLTYTLSSIEKNPGKNPYYCTAWQDSCSRLEAKQLMNYDLPF